MLPVFSLANQHIIELSHSVSVFLQPQNQSMAIVPVIQSAVSVQINQLYQVDIEPSSITVSETKPEFEGDYTVVLFALLKTLKKTGPGGR
jgi:hypothetical protein